MSGGPKFTTSNRWPPRSQYLREHDLMDYDALAASTEAAVDRAHKLAEELRDTEAALSKTSELMARWYSMQRRALCSMVTRRPGTVENIWPSTSGAGRLPGGQSYYERSFGRGEAPENGCAEKERRELSEKRKALYAEYRKAQAEMRQAVAVKANIDICSAIRMGVKIRPRSDSSGPQTTRDFWTKCPEVRRVWGAPQQAFSRACGL